MKRFSILLMLLFSVFALLAACGGPETREEQDPAENPCADENPCTTTVREDDGPPPAVGKEMEPDLMAEVEDKPSDETSVVEEPTTDEPSTEEPTTDEPSTEEPTTDEPTTDEPATDEPKKQRPRWAGGSASKGKGLYKKCKGCHGTTEKPGKLGPELFSKKWSRAEKKEAFETIEDGKGKMPAFGDKLDDGEIADLIAYVSD